MSGPAEIDHLALAVTFHFADDRVQYLRRMAAEFPKFARRVDIYIVSNRGDDEARTIIGDALGGQPFELLVPQLLGHPFLLTWSHMDVFKRLLRDDASITHFLYTEDDHLITASNIAYWLRGREELRSHGFVPSFLRFETRHDGVAMATDAARPWYLPGMPRVTINPGYAYLNSESPYQGLYLLDRELMSEYFASSGYNPDHGIWGIREHANAGVTFVDIPAGFTARNLLGFDVERRSLDPGCLVEHLPANYSNGRPDVPYGKTPMRELFNGSPVRFHLRRWGRRLFNAGSVALRNG